MKLEQLIEKRIQRIALMVEGSTRKIVRKELKKFKKELIRGMLKKNEVRKNNIERRKG